MVLIVVLGNNNKRSIHLSSVCMYDDHLYIYAYIGPIGEKGMILHLHRCCYLLVLWIVVSVYGI